jgi:hypothetical protein
MTNSTMPAGWVAEGNKDFSKLLCQSQFNLSTSQTRRSLHLGCTLSREDGYMSIISGIKTPPVVMPKSSQHISTQAFSLRN